MSVAATSAPAGRLSTVAQAVARHAAERPDEVAFRFLARHASQTRELSWGALDESARPVAAALAARGLTGKRVAIICPDPKDFVIALTGTLRADCVAVPVPAIATRRSADRIRSIIEASRPSAILAPSNVLGQPWIASLLENAAIVAIDLDSLGDAAGGAIRPTAGFEAPALVQFTSGSTGQPRGVILSNNNLSANCAAIVETYDLDIHTRGFSWLPLHHDMGLVGHILAPLWVGCRSTLMDPLLFLQSPLRWLQRAGEERATITSAPNFAYELCVRAAAEHGVDGIDLSSLTAAVCGGEPVWPETVERFCRTFAAAGFDRDAFAPSYGLAEATLLVSSGRRAGGPSVFSGAVRNGIEGTDGAMSTVNLGIPVSGITVRIVDAAGETCPEGSVGEIVIAGDSVGKLTGRADTRGDEASVRTGDLGFFRGGELHVTGRQKELIILRGQNVYPADIESAALRADPAIRPGAVAAIAVREEGTEALVVVFEAERGFEREGFATLCQRLNQAIAQATGHIPAGIFAVPPGRLPRTSSGKIKRNQVSDLCRSGELPILASAGQTPVRQEAVAL